MTRAINHAQIVRMRREGKSIIDIAHACGCCNRTVSTTLRAAGLSTGQRKFFVSREQITELWFQDMPLMEIAKRLGCSQATVTKIAKGYGLPRKAPSIKPVYNDPTPAEIAERCAEIKARHLAHKRSESDDVTRRRVWDEDRRTGRIPLEVA